MRGPSLRPDTWWRRHGRAPGVLFSGCLNPRNYPDVAGGPGLADGPYAFEVRATDASHNTDQSPARRDFTVDTVAPAAPVITVPSSGARQNGNTVGMMGTAEVGSTVEVLEGTAVKGTARTDASGGWTVFARSVSDGSHTYTARAVDDAGHASGLSDAVTIIVDNGPPETTINSGPNGLTAENTPTFTFGGTDAVSTVSELFFFYRIDEGEWSESQSETSATLANLSDGRHTFEVKAWNGLNEDPSPAQRSFTVDTVKPTVLSVTPRENLTGVVPGTSLTATFSEKMQKATLTKATFKLFKVTSTGTTQVTNVTVSLSADGLKATLDPFGTSTTQLAKNAKYKAVLTTGAKDLAGNALDQSPSLSGDQPKSWTFKIRS